MATKKKLIIVESPAKAVTIKKFLGSDYTIEASKGHIRDLPKSKLGVDVEHDFEPEYINIRGKGDLIKSLKTKCKSADETFLATDPDREGEAISWHLANILGINPESKCRVTFNEITKKTVTESLKNPRPIDMDLTDAQQARRVMDRVVGYKISPLLWKKVGRGLSAGRVQSVAVKLICDREEEIENFIPEEYWNIYATFEKQKTKETFKGHFYGKNGKKQELHSKEEVDKILKDIEGQKYIVSNIKKGEKKKTPAPPFTTSTMQQEASRKLGFPLKKTMSTAQGLYEGVRINGSEVGLITYMRTDSTRISDEARNAAHKQIVKEYGEEYYENRFYKVSKDAQDGHEGIRPTSIERTPESIKQFLQPDQYKLYKLIYNRFLASQMAAAIYKTTAVDIEVNKYNFKANGQKLIFKGFMALYVESLDYVSKKKNDVEEDEETNSIPELEIGEEVLRKDINPKQSFTEPPPRYTEASLVKALEENGIGRPSTYSPTITTIIARRYIEKQQKSLLPTDLGKTVNKLLVENFEDIVNVKFTAGIEDEFDKVAEGKENWKKVIKDFYDPFIKEVEKAEKDLERIKIPDEETDEICEKCGKHMVIKNGRFGKFLACSGYPDCKNAKPYVQYIDVPCPVCGKRVYTRKTSRGKVYYICEGNHQKTDPNSCNYISWDKPKVGETWTPDDNEKPKTRKRRTTKRKTTKKATTKKKTTKKK